MSHGIGNLRVIIVIVIPLRVERGRRGIGRGGGVIGLILEAAARRDLFLDGSELLSWVFGV